MVNPLLLLDTSPYLKIPLHFSNEEKTSYISQLKTHFVHIDKYLKNCKTSDFQPIIKNVFCERINGFHYSIVNVVQHYLNGYPSKAYQLFEKALKDYEIANEIISLMQIQIPKNSSFFRTQKNHTPNVRKYEDFTTNMHNPLDLFHPKFQHRRFVPSNRFSISGYPSLYISENLQTSYSESFPNDESGSFHVVCFKNIRPLYFIDLSQKKLFRNKFLFEGVLPKKGKSSSFDVAGFLDNFGAYQLILASHIKMQYKKSDEREKLNFKAEYIIPQLLLQWIKQQNLAVDGIRYYSCTAANKYPGIKNYYNYTLPVRQSLQKGYCPSLCSLFSSCEVYSYFNNRLTASQLKKIELELNNSKFKFLA